MPQHIKAALCLQLFTVYFTSKNSIKLSLQFLLLISITLMPLKVFADTSAGFAFNTSEMENTGVFSKTGDEQTFQKNSLSFYTNSSFAEERLFFTMQTELVSITRKAYTVRNTFFPEEQNEGISSVKMHLSKYLFTSRGWRNHFLAGYNTKGYEENDNVAFAFLYGETVLGTVFTKKPPIRGIITPIVRGMLSNSNERDFIHISYFHHISKEYTADSILFYRMLPLNKRAYFKILGKYKEYSFKQNAQRLFLDEAKIAASITFKNKNYNGIEFSIFYDDKIKETGVSLGYSYYIRHNNTNPLSRTFNRFDEKYNVNKRKKKTERSGAKINSNEIRDEVRKEVRNTLEELGII